MTLIPIEHAHRLPSAADAESLFRALGARSVSARGFHTKDRTRFTALVEAIEPKADHSISFQQGVLDRPSLEALARAPFGYLDIRTSTASYRSWPERHTWVHAKSELAAPFSLDTTSIPTALEAFARLSDDNLQRGFITGVTPDAKPLLLAFLDRLGATVDAVLDIEVASARALTELYTGEKLDWQADGVLVDFPEGTIHGYLTTPNIGEDAREAWRTRIDKALRKAGLI